MKKLLPYAAPAAVLLMILAFSLWTGARMSRDTERWRAQIAQSDTLAQAEQWPGAAAALETCYSDWSTRQTYLHIVCEHQAVDDAGAMFRRAMAFADTQELSEFRAELADLTDQLRLLAEMERFSVKNVL